jgi:hypothetical protein
MCVLERVRGDAGIVAPHFLQQHFARHRTLPGAVEKAQDRGLLLGEADLVALRVHQQLRARPERVGPDGEHRVLARLVLAQLRADAREQHRKAERFGDVVVRAGLEPEDRVGIGVVAGQHDDRRLEAVLAQDAHGLAPVHVGQADVHDHEIHMAVAGGLHALRTGIDRLGVELLVQCELFDQRVAQLGVVIDDQDFPRVGHKAPPGREPLYRCAK